jgi:hypothetical protein
LRKGEFGAVLHPLSIIDVLSYRHVYGLSRLEATASCEEGNVFLRQLITAAVFIENDVSDL